MVAGAAAGGVIAGLMIAKNIKRLNDGIATAKDAWKTLATDGIELEIVDGRPTLSGEKDGVAVFVRIVTDVVQYAHTMVEAPLASSVDYEAAVYPSPAGLLGKIRTMLAQDIVIGDEVFDEAFLIQGKPEQVAAPLLQGPLRELLTALAGSSLAGFKLEDGKAVVQLRGVETDPTVLQAAIDAVIYGAHRASEVDA